MLNGSFGFDGMNNGFANMGFPGTTDFNQMMQMMPNTMPNALMGTFPNMMGMCYACSCSILPANCFTIGMPGIGMDPMAMSQAMYGGFGGPGMGMNGMHGMNGMSMGMGMNAMNAGQGAFGGFNGQPDAWNSGQDNFNPNAYGGHANGMGGDFGPHSGYGGYNMPSHRGNFNQMNHQQFPHNDTQNGFNGQGFPNRGRGRRGGYNNNNNNNNGRGRGSYNQVTQGNYGNHANYEPFHHQLPTHVAQQNPQQASKYEQQQDRNPDDQMQASKESQQDPTPGATATDQEMQDQISKELNPGDEDDKSQTDKVVLPTSADTTTVAESSEVRTEPEKEAPSTSKQSEEPRKIEEPKLAPIQTYISNEDDRPHKPASTHIAKVEPTTMPPPFPAIPLGPAALYSQDHSLDSSGRGRGSGRGYYRGSSEIRGGFRGRGAGYTPNGNSIHSSPMQAPPPTTLPPITPAEPKGLGVEGAPKGPKALREGLPNTSIRGGRGFSIVGRASAAAYAQPNGVTRLRRFVLIFCF